MMLNYEKEIYNSGWVQISNTSGSVSGTDPGTGEDARCYFKVSCRRKIVQNLKTGTTHYTADARIAKTNEGVRKLQSGAYFLIQKISLKVGTGEKQEKPYVRIPLDTDAQTVEKPLGNWAVELGNTSSLVKSFVLEFDPLSKSVLHGFLFSQELENTSTIPAWSSEAPTATVTSVTANRYGANASASFNFGHSLFNTEARFTLYDLTGEESAARKSSATSITANSATYEFGGTGSNNPKTLSLDGTVPLRSGAEYRYNLEVEAQNGKKTNLSGVLKVPQRVLSLSANPQLNVRFSGTAPLIYSVLPADAEEKTVTFSTSDARIATVSDGIVTGVRPGVAELTITTVDGGFTATVTVSVIDAEFMPELPDSVERCSADLLNALNQAANFLNQDLSLGLTLPAVTAERNVDPRELKELIEAVNANVSAVISAAVNAGKAPEEVTEEHAETIADELPKQNDGTLANIIGLSIYDLTLINEFNN